MTELTGKFNWQVSKVVPAFVEGEDAKAVYDSTEGIRTGKMGYDESSKLFYGSSPFAAARIDTQVKPLGMRVATLRDLSRPEVMRMVKGQHYSDSPALVLRTLQDSYSKNLPLIRRVAEEVEKVKGKLELPLMISGFDVAQWNEDVDGYKINIAPREDFKIISDDRLSGKWNSYRFEEVDEFGLPLNLDKANGSRVWYARDNGLSGLYLLWNLSLDSNNENLASSSGNGRVVLISGGATAQNFTQQYQQRLQSKVDAAKSELDKWYADSMAKMPKGGK